MPGDKLNQEIKNNPSANNYLKLGIAQHHLGEFEKAFESLTKAINSEPKLKHEDLANAYIYRALVDPHLGKWELFTKDREAAYRETNNIPCVRRAIQRLEEKKLQSTDNNKKEQEQWEQFDKKEKRKYNLKVKKLNKEIKDKPIADNYYHRGLAHYRLGKFDEAIKDLTKALELEHDPAKRADSLKYRGRAYSAQHKYHLAAIDYTAENRIESGNNSYMMYFRSSNKNNTSNQNQTNEINCNDDQGIIHPPISYFGGSSYEKALKRFDKVFQPCDRTNPNYYYERGLLHYDAENYKKALENFNIAIEKTAGKFVYPYFAARRDAYLKLNQDDLAAEDLKEIIKHCPNYKSENGNLNLEKVKNDKLKQVEVDITGESHKINDNHHKTRRLLATEESLKNLINDNQLQLPTGQETSSASSSRGGFGFIPNFVESTVNTINEAYVKPFSFGDPNPKAPDYRHKAESYFAQQNQHDMLGLLNLLVNGVKMLGVVRDWWTGEDKRQEEARRKQRYATSPEEKKQAKLERKNKLIEEGKTLKENNSEWEKAFRELPESVRLRLIKDNQTVNNTVNVLLKGVKPLTGNKKIFFFSNEQHNQTQLLLESDKTKVFTIS